MEITNLSVNPSSLVNILTLRYDSSITPNLPRKTWEDFVPTENHFNSEIIEKLICNSIEKKLEKFSGKKISIALSGGVDSTLVLSLIRKVNPDIDIQAISIKFSAITYY